MCDKMAISAYILKIVEKDPFLRLQMRAKEMLNRHQFFFSTDKQYVKIKLVLASIGLTKKRFGHQAILMIFSSKSPRKEWLTLPK